MSNLWTKLSPREHEVAELLLLGCDQAEIAKELKLTRRTVKAYFRKMFIHAEMSGFTGIKQVKLAVMLHHDRHQADLMPQLRHGALAVDRKGFEKTAEVTYETEIHVPITVTVDPDKPPHAPDILHALETKEWLSTKQVEQLVTLAGPLNMKGSEEKYVHISCNVDLKHLKVDSLTKL